MRQIKSVGVLGAGIMGAGITQALAVGGYGVKVLEIAPKAVDKAKGVMSASLGKFHEKGKLVETPAEIVSRVEWFTDAAALADVDYVIESVPEVMEIKRDILGRVCRICRPEVVFATNTSQFSITALASATSRPRKFIGMHWFNPAVIMKLIEVVRGFETSDDTLEITLDLCRNLGKEAVVCRKDAPGFITTRMLSLWGAEAARILEEGIASAEDIDKACRLGFGHPMGPFELSDFSGLDTSLKVRQRLFETYGERYRPTSTMVNLVNAGHYGRKTGRGYHDYSGGKR